VFRRKKAYTLIELVVVLGIMIIIASITSLNVGKIKNTINKISLEESINEARSILSFGKSYCRKNRVHGMIVISENRLSFIVQENDYKIDKSTELKGNLEVNSNFEKGRSIINKDGYISLAGTIVLKLGNSYGEIKIGVGNDIIGVSEVDIIE